MSVRETVDAALIAHYRFASAERQQFRGLSVLKYQDELAAIVCATGAVTLLDYGCGLGQQYTDHHLHERLGVPMPALYDPGVVGLETKPQGRFDGVICSDVLEHVPERLVENVIAECFDYADKFVWFSVCCRPAKKCFADGTNLHVTIKPPSWWKKLVKRVAAGRQYQLIFTP